MLMMNRTMMLITLAATLAGCTAASQKYIAIPTTGQTAAQAQADITACEASAKADKDENMGTAILVGGWIGYLGIHEGYHQTYKECMRLKGHTFKEDAK